MLYNCCVTLRNRSLLDLAHEMRQCLVQIPDACQGESPEGLEPAHANWQMHGRGLGHKADDVFAAACPGCHRALDGGNRLSRADRIFYWHRGAIRTWAYLMQHGWLTISPTRLVDGQR